MAHSLDYYQELQSLKTSLDNIRDYSFRPGFCAILESETYREKLRWAGTLLEEIHNDAMRIPDSTDLTDNLLNGMFCQIFGLAMGFLF